MADSITTNANLLDDGIMLAVDIGRLSTERLMNHTTSAGDPFPWKPRHERAWSETLKRLKQREHALEEDDLTDTTELTRTVGFHVAYQAYALSMADDDKKRADDFYAKWRKEAETVGLSVSGGTAEPGRGGYHRAYRV